MTKAQASERDSESAWSLPKWRARELGTSEEDAREGRFRTDSIVIPVTEDNRDAVWAQAREMLLRYEIFPKASIEGYVDSAGGKVAPDTTVVQRAKVWGVKMEMATRVLDVHDEEDLVAFRYATLEGHAERGIARFALQRQPGGVHFTIQSWSRPGNVLARVATPLTNRVQRKFTLAALKHFRDAVLATAVP